jgi:UDP-N-acetylmuramoyl-L-alanyl-D-glutamate--2,6-diaminopimelate ligase
MKIAELITTVTPISIVGNSEKNLTGLAWDSRFVQEGFGFFALKGLHTDGHRFIDSAVDRGASAVFCEEIPENLHPDTCYIQLKNSRTSISPIAAKFFDYPCEKIQTLGVTGTDGKSTTVYILHQLLDMLDSPSGFFSTVFYKTENTILKNELRQSTPEANQVQEAIFHMVQSGKQSAVIESTSHGLSKVNNRLGDVFYDAAVFTNISHEHLEFHGSFEQYRFDKANLFRQLKKNGFGVVNANDQNHRYFIEAAENKVYTYGLENNQADFQVSIVSSDSSGSDIQCRFEEKTYEARVSLPAEFNVENACAAALTVHKLLGRDLQEVLDCLNSLEAVPGRMQLVPKVSEDDPTVIVDYAHSPGSFEKLFPIIQKSCRGKLIIVFGSAGERDKAKRPIQGEIASRFADVLILADEDPRGENPLSILEEIAAGVQNMKEDKDLFLIPDRQDAIIKAVQIAKTDDVVLLLGKGHESSIQYKTGDIEWSDFEAGKTALIQKNKGKV